MNTEPETSPEQTSEFSRIVQMAELGSKPLVQSLSASTAENEALSKRYNVDGLNALTAQATLTLLSPREVRLDADVVAKVLQKCVVTNEDIESNVEFTFTLTYDKDAVESETQNEDDDEDFEDVDLMAEPAEVLIEDRIDVGEAIAEQLALEIDPFPRSKTAMFNGYTSGSLGDTDTSLEKKNPFAVLSELKLKQDK